MIRVLRVSGAVQGVGFRPFVYRTASACGISGWVKNDAQGVLIRAIGSEEDLDRFQSELATPSPPARVDSLAVVEEKGGGEAGAFDILPSDTEGAITASVTPDLATCPDCLHELLDPSNRRYLYSFTNCTQCGPRYTILERIPYDRPNTTMKRFTMCPACQAEYENPADRRFHAQPNACPVCGPQLALWDGDGRVSGEKQEALIVAAAALGDGRIVAVKGLGGFHLFADARNDAAVLELRRRKHREEKPFAVMFPEIGQIRRSCQISEQEEQCLISPESPMVLLCKHEPEDFGAVSANPLLGAMLPYTPLHHLLMRELGFPVVATSGNLSDEPICFDNDEALSRLRGIADLFLVHDRPIARPVDDSIVRVMAGRPVILRRARGYAPQPVKLPRAVDEPLVAVGGHLKNTVALAVGENAFVSQHLGDLDTEPAYRAFEDAVHLFEGLYQAKPSRVVCDMHPDYASTRYARNRGGGLDPVQHHHAHVVSCMMDNDLEGTVLGVSWDGTGYGPDGTVWGGEFLLADCASFKRVGHLRTFCLPGGDQAIREPRRSALGLLYELFGESVFDMTDLPPIRAFDRHELIALRGMLEKGIQSPRTSSAGRLFDAVASLLDIRQISTFEGQAAMEVEFVCMECGAPAPLSLPKRGQGRALQGASREIDWEPMIRQVIADVQAGVDKRIIARAFHEALAGMIVDTARAVGEKRVVLTGGCFQNARLLERSVALLREAGYDPYWHRQIPPNDGGISLGQLGVALLKPET